MAKRVGRGSTELRRKAERRLEASKTPARRKKPDQAPARKADAQPLSHELEVHQVELELQNEELKNSRAEVEAALGRYTEVFDFAPIGYATLTENSLIDTINHAGTSLLGQPRRALLRRPFAAFLAPDSRGTLALLIDAARGSTERKEAEVQIALDAGGTRRLRLWMTTLASAQPVLLVAFEDVSEHKAKAEQLARTEEALRESNRRKDDFLAMLSHELRNPLAPIRNCLYLLARAEPGSDRARKAQGIIEQQVTHLTRLVDDLLDVTRISRGKIQLHREHVSLPDLVGKTLDAQRSDFEAKGVSLRASLEPGEHWIFADPTRVVQALSNVLGNAAKFTPRGGTVTVGLRQQAQHVILEVCDTGIGVAPELAPYLFEPFAQAPQTMERSAGGLGLGLAMVKGLVELHGGSVTMTSDGLGRGTTIAMTFAAAAPPSAATSFPEAQAPTPRRILIIEDNRDSAESLRDALALAGHEVEVAFDGPSGLVAARRSRPEVVICDIGLPGMDGYEVASSFQRESDLQGAYLIALSGYARPDDLERAAGAGFARHVAKPPSLDGLLDLLQTIPPTTLAPEAPPPTAR